MSWLDRQSFLGSDSDQVLNELTFGLIGLGGGGSHVSQQLAHVGAGNFVLVDSDIISDTNLNRLVGGLHADVEREQRKIDIAERIIRGVNPRARVEKHFKQWQEVPEALRNCDIVIGGVDSVRAKQELDAFCRRFMIPYIDMGMDVHKVDEDSYLVAGQVVLTGPGEPCLQCLNIVNEESLAREAARYGDAGSKPQVVWPNGLLASAAVALAIQLVLPWNRKPITSAFLEYDGNMHTFKEALIFKRRSFIACPHYGPMDCGDPMFDIRHYQEPEVTSPMSIAQPAKSFWSKLWGAFHRWIKP